MALSAPAQEEPRETWIPLYFPCPHTGEGEAHGPGNRASFCFASCPRPLWGGHGRLHTSGDSPSSAKLFGLPHSPTPTGDLFARFFSPLFFLHNNSDPFCYCFSRLIEYVLFAVEACRPRQAQQAQHEVGLGGLAHLGSLGPAQAGQGASLGDQGCELTSHRQHPTGVGRQAGRRASYLLFNLFFLIEQIIPKLFFFKKLKKKSFGCTTQHVGSSFPNQGSNPHPQHWQCGDLTTGPPGFLFLFSCLVMSSSLRSHGL